MAKKCLVVKASRKPKYKVRGYTRCMFCGRSRAVYKRFLLCRICFRQHAVRGLIPGLYKASL